MKNLLIAGCFLILSGCGIPETMDAVKETPKKMDGMQQGMNETNEAVRQQKMLLALEHMTNKEAQTWVYPVPTYLMPFAKTLAEALTPHEAVELIFANLNQIDDVGPVKLFGIDGKEVPFSLEKQNDILLMKYTVLQGLLAVSGFLPQATVEQIIQTEIQGQGRFIKTAKNILMMRTMFLYDIMLGQSLFKSGTLDSVGAAETAEEYMTKVDYVLQLPFASSIGLKTGGLQTPAGYDGPIGNVEITLNSEEITRQSAGWSELASMTSEANLPIQESAVTGKPEADQAIYQQSLQRRAHINERAQERQSYWKTKQL